MASQPPPEIDPKQLEEAQSLWENFGVATKWGVILTVALLGLLGILFL